jgi:hypothetical protein
MADKDVTAVLAPKGFDAGALVLAGLANGTVLRLD